MTRFTPCHCLGTRLTVVEPVYGTVITLARCVWRLQGLKFTVTGVENLPTTGGAVVAINHTSYFDFTFAGLPAFKQGLGRKVRFMAKREVFDSKVSGPIMRSLRHIPVDRDSGGAASFAEACQRLKEGELVGVYPEATISRSFEIKEFKSGCGAHGHRRRRADRPAHRLGAPSASGPRATPPRTCDGPRCPSRSPSANRSCRRSLPPS